MEINYFGTLLLSRIFAPVLAANGSGAIVNVLSALSWISVPDGGTYSASEAVAWSLTNWLRTGLRRQGTQVVGVHVGLVDAHMASRLKFPKTTPAEVVQQVRYAVEAGISEVLADEMSRQVRACQMRQAFTLISIRSALPLMRAESNRRVRDAQGLRFRLERKKRATNCDDQHHISR